MVLGLLFGVTFGVATAAVAGARRTEDALPRYLAASGTFHAAVLPNDPAFDAAQQDAVAALPEVRAAYPFMVPFALQVLQPANVEASLLPTTPGAGKAMAGVIVDGRLPDPRKPDEIVVNQSLAAGGLEIGVDDDRRPVDLARGACRVPARASSPTATWTSAPGCTWSGSRSRPTTRPTGCRPARSSPSTEIVSPAS